MKKATKPRPTATPQKKSAVRTTGPSAAERQLAENLKTAIDGVSTAIMMVDRDFLVTYVNTTTRRMLETHADTFRSVWPGFDPTKIVGSCIDMFHRNPAHQRRMLADPKNLPYRTDISVGPLKFSLCVSATYDLKGNYSGNILEWADVTELRQREAINADQASQIAAISANQAVIEFNMDGTIIKANENFLTATGYTLAEIQGKHHRIFVDKVDSTSVEYHAFWEKLTQGQAFSGQFRRIRKNGSDLWIQASYNPIPDATGKPARVVKYAMDITEAKLRENQTNRALQETGRVMQALAEGDLRDRMTGDYTGEFSVLRDAVNTCRDNLLRMVRQIRSAASNIEVSASEISQGNNDLSQRTEQQAASIEETASSMEELTGTVRQNADNARQANQLAASAREQAEKGGSVVSTAVTAMGGINDASKKIADIIGVIDEIAFQTNLLALNAAVEAARAGEQGRGFAVVAAEVRNLAQRSAGAAKEIKNLIKDSVSKVEEGSKYVNESGATLQQIVAAVKKVSDIVSEIAEASAEQSAGIDRIGQAIAQMDQAVQQNAALVEEATAASKAMDDQSRGLVELMSRFQLDDSEEEEAAVAMPQRAPLRQTAAPPTRPTAAASARPQPTAARPAARAALPKRSTAVADAPAEGAGRWEEF